MFPHPVQGLGHLFSVAQRLVQQCRPRLKNYLGDGERLGGVPLFDALRETFLEIRLLSELWEVD
jgi:hypothetical protein